MQDPVDIQNSATLLLSAGLNAAHTYLAMEHSLLLYTHCAMFTINNTRGH